MHIYILVKYPQNRKEKEKRKKNWGAYGAHSFRYFHRVIRIPNMCLVLKLDNGKVVSIKNGQTE